MWIWSTRTRLRSVFTRTSNQGKFSGENGEHNVEAPITRRSSNPARNSGGSWRETLESFCCLHFVQSNYVQTSCSISRNSFTVVIFIFKFLKHLTEEVTEDSTFHTIIGHNYIFDITWRQLLALPHLLFYCSILLPFNFTLFTTDRIPCISQVICFNGGHGLLTGTCWLFSIFYQKWKIIAGLNTV